MASKTSQNGHEPPFTCAVDGTFNRRLRPYNRPSNRKGMNARSSVLAAGRASTACRLTSTDRPFTEDKHTGPLGEVQSGSDDGGSFV
jgi:hypothetical protein